MIDPQLLDTFRFAVSVLITIMVLMVISSLFAAFCIGASIRSSQISRDEEQWQ